MRWDYGQERGTRADTPSSAKTGRHRNINLAGGAGSRPRPLHKIFSGVERQHGCKDYQRPGNKKRGEEEPAA